MSKFIKTLFKDDSRSSAVSEIASVWGLKGSEAAYQINISATGSVLVEGRISADAPWATIETVTASKIQPAYGLAQIRCTITANTGTVSAFVGAPS